MPTPRHIRIERCSDSRLWYATKVGQTLPYEWFELNRSSSQGLPGDVYWCREGGTYNAINWILASDAVEVNDQGVALP